MLLSSCFEFLFIMTNRYLLSLFFFVSIFFFECSSTNPTPKNQDPFVLNDFSLDNRPISYTYSSASVKPILKIRFSEQVDKSSPSTGIILSNNVGNFPLEFSFSNHDSTVIIQPVSPLNYLSIYYFTISKDLKSATQKSFDSNAAIKIVTQIIFGRPT